MDLQPAGAVKLDAPNLAASDPAPEPHHGPFLGSTQTGEAARRHLSVRIGLWLDEAGWVRQARWRAVDDPALRALAEAACSLLESGANPLQLDGDSLRTAAAQPPHADDRADLVCAAIHAALLVGGHR
jgi:hypothetical protein